ncbi:TlpA family protein disulfide reductase [Gemmiger formicilis]|uniref:TlpA family protein disulfide reductase n=1 Tax=Gemmiger formicilis TaxID=745368 RepID=UPI003CF779D3
MKRFFAWITALLMLLSLAACSSTQTSTAASSQQASTSETGKSENELIAEENDILAANNALWEKVFASMDKNVTDTTLSSNYGDILMSALDHAKDQFTDEEYAALKADADKIREIETQITALPQDEAASQSMTQTTSTFPQFEGKDLDGNSVNSSLFADNAFTVVNFWFSGCKPCVDEMDDLNALNQRIQEQGGEVIGINTETLDGNADNIAAARQILEQAGAAFRNIYFDSASDAGKFALGIMAFPTTCVVDRQGNIVGEPIMGGIDKEDNAAALQKLIDEALAQSQQ